MNFATYWKNKLKEDRKRKLKRRRKPLKKDKLTSPLENGSSKAYYNQTGSGTTAGASSSTFVMKG